LITKVILSAEIILGLLLLGEITSKASVGLGLSGFVKGRNLAGLLRKFLRGEKICIIIREIE